MDPALEIPSRVRESSIPHWNRGAWSCTTLVQRQCLVLAADWVNLVLLFVQPVLIALLINFIVTREASLPKKLFLGDIAVMWMACSNAAQVIVKERTIIFRERLAGLELRRYVLSKFLVMWVISTIQVLLLLLLLYVLKGSVPILGKPFWLGEGMVGNIWWQLLAYIGSAWVLTGFGIVISSASKTPIQAALWVPLVIIPQILMAGYVYPLEEWKTQPVARYLSWTFPSAAAEKLMDMSLLWNVKIHPDPLTTMGVKTPHLMNLKLSLVPFPEWFQKERRQLVIPAEVLRKVYAPGGPEVKPIYYMWPSNAPELQTLQVYRHWGAAAHPVGIFVFWITASFVASVVILARGRFS